MGFIRFVLCPGHGIDTNIPCNRCNSCTGLFFSFGVRYSKTVYIMTDKVKQVIWVFDVEDNKKKRINLQTLLKRVNHYSRNSVHSSKNIKYFALEKDRDEFAKDCRS